MCTRQHKHACLSAPLFVENFFFFVPRAASHCGVCGMALWTPKVEVVFASRWIKPGVFDRLISNQWLETFTLRSSVPPLPSSLFFSLSPGPTSTSCSNMTCFLVSPALSLVFVKSFVLDIKQQLHSLHNPNYTSAVIYERHSLRSKYPLTQAVGILPYWGKCIL